MREYVEFHNPTAAPRQANLVLDFRGLPPEVRASFVLTRLDIVQPLGSSITGIQQRGRHHGVIGELAHCWAYRIEDKVEQTMVGAVVVSSGGATGGVHYQQYHSAYYSRATAPFCTTSRSRSLRVS